MMKFAQKRQEGISMIPEKIFWAILSLEALWESAEQKKDTTRAIERTGNHQKWFKVGCEVFSSEAGQGDVWYDLELPPTQEESPPGLFQF